MKHFFSGRRKPAAVVVGLLVVGVATLVALPFGTARASGSTPLQVTEHFNGHTFTLTPGNWHGAKDCAIVARTQAYCFSSNEAFNQFTGTPRTADGSVATDAATASPLSTGVCNGWAKIWQGINWTGIGLAFEDYGYQQNLSDYTTVPFGVESWFTDGQRGYSHMTNCFGIAWSPGSITLHTNAESTNDGQHFASYIELYSGTG